MKHQSIDEGVKVLMKSRGPIDDYGLTSGMFTVPEVPSPLVQRPGLVTKR